MTLPGVFVDQIDVQPTIDQSLAVHQKFIVAPFAKGPITPLRAFSLDELIDQRGSYVSYGLGIEDAESYFRECGDGGTVVTQRAVGPAPVLATLNLSSAAPAVVVTVNAASYGDWANKLAVTVTTTTGSNRTVVLDHDDDGVLSTGTYASAAALRTALELTGLVTTSLGAGTWPIANLTRTHLAGGTDDHANILDANYQTAINGLDRRLGPGMVSIPGATTDTLHEIVAQHCKTFGRHNLNDLVDVAASAASSLVTSAAALRTSTAATKASTGAPWLITPDGREVPPTGAVAGLVARQFLKTGNPNQAAAGDEGELRWHVGLTHDLESVAETLNDAGVNLFRDVDGQGTLQLYGFRTVVNPVTDKLNLQLSNVLLDMYITARAKKIGASMEFRQIDGKGLLASIYGGRLDAMLRELYDLGALYGETPGEAYQVDVGPSVNTPTTAAAGQLKAKIAARRSQFAEQTFLNITVYAVSEAIA
ncbi:MAG: Phage tail sheath protein [Frankiales bacterium]|nr:Phage tail sheath protein [Frankiales bacterium]